MQSRRSHPVVWYDNLFIVKHNVLPVNTTIILITIVLVLIHN